MSTYIFVLGKHRNISIAELHARYPKADFQSVGDDFVVLDSLASFDQKELDQLGGIIKVAKQVHETDREGLIDSLPEVLKVHYQDTKLNYGLSVYGFSEKQLRPLILKLKKTLQKEGVKSRFINRNFKNISTAQYKSIRKKGIELLIVKADNQFLIGEVVGVQDIDAYSKRDYEKPFRDMQMGMLPPKLAQILINLTGVEGKIWDPFCGSGTLVAEGMLMGRPMMGSDIERKRVEGAERNVKWLQKEFQISAKADLFVHDATQPLKGKNFDAIAFEGNLGMLHGRHFSDSVVKTQIKSLDQLYIGFFSVLREAGFKGPVVVALPFFRPMKGKEIEMSDTIRAIKKMGFDSMPLLPAGFGMERYHLKYARPDQAVGRMIMKFQLT